jgi:hypothetical protein
MIKTTTYGRLKELLESLGLVPLPLPKKGEYFTTPSGRTLLLFPEYQANDLVRPVDLVMTRRQLDENGYMERADFERFLEQRETA